VARELYDHETETQENQNLADNLRMPRCLRSSRDSCAGAHVQKRIHPKTGSC
jgi:hypothetical protein